MTISKNVSAILRVLCFEEDLYFHASNIKGSDMAFLKENACESNGVIEYNFIQAQQLGNSTGIIRKYAHSGKDIIIYSGKGQAPVVLVKEKKMLLNKFFKLSLITFMVWLAPLIQADYEDDTEITSEQRAVLALGVLAVIYAATTEDYSDNSLSYINSYIGKQIVLNDNSGFSFEILPTSKFMNEKFNLRTNNINSNNLDIFRIKYNL